MKGMGYNSGLIVLNDALYVIEQNPLQFTEGVVRAIQSAGGHLRTPPGRIDIAVQGHVNAASLFHMAHADEHQVYVVGGNCAQAIKGGFTSIRGYQDSDETNLALLKSMADEMGFRLVKKSKG